WGSHGDNPNAANAKFGSKKKNNTPPAFRINGKYVESYFSPTDGVNAKIVETINTADHDLSISTMLITRIEMADAIAERAGAGIATNVITNSEGGNNSNVNATLTAALSTHFTFDNVSSGILHHKYMIVDQGAPASDPMLWTGSHNWSAAADNENDENTLIIHDATVANIYYQEFVKRFVDNQGVLIDLDTPPVAVADNATGVIDELFTVAVLNNDEFLAPVSLSIETAATHGNAYVPFSNPNVVIYQPELGFFGEDSIVYKIAYQADATLYSTAKVYFTVVDNTGIGELSSVNTLKVNPNPATAVIHIPLSSTISSQATLTITDMQGKAVYTTKLAGDEKDIYLNLDGIGIQSGVYLVVLKDQHKIATNRLIVY
ncbi:MAG: phospholipase D-like domain-containing protein, partial [Bacteroidales bacterium]|nr:phospholipase D-like domain-containing protein [Bacteroidales bacterium]